MAGAGQEKINRDDLFLLMESYKNTIELNTTLLERQEIVNRYQIKLMENISEVCGNQSIILSQIESIPDAIYKAADRLSKEFKKANEGHISELKAIEKQTINDRNAAMAEHAGFNNRLYVALSGMICIIIALIGVIIKLA